MLNVTPPSQLHPLSLHDALPISRGIKIKVVPLDCGAHKCCSHCAPGFGALFGSTELREACCTSSGVFPGHVVILSEGSPLPTAQRIRQHLRSLRSPEIGGETGP